MTNLRSSNNLRSAALRIAQVAWVILVSLAIAKFTLGIVVYYQASSEICTGTVQDCHVRQHVTLQDMDSLLKSGISLEQWAIYIILYHFLSALIFCVVGFLIFHSKARRPGCAIHGALFGFVWHNWWFWR